MTPIPLYIRQKIIYIFEKPEINKNINFTKLELIEAIRKCLCRYIACAKIKDDFYTEDLNADLFELLLKEDLWGKNIEMIKLKESFKYIYNNIQFKIKTKYIFNLFEILIGISNKEYLSLKSFNNFKEKENDDEWDILEISEKGKENDAKIEENKQLNDINPMAKPANMIIRPNLLDDENPNIEIKNKQMNEEKNDDIDLDKSEDSIFENHEEYNLIKNRKKCIYEQLEKSKFFSKYLDLIFKSEKNQNKKNLDYDSYSAFLMEVIKFGSIFHKENLIHKINKFIKEPKIDIKFSSLKVKTDLLQVENNIKNIIVFNKDKLIFLFEDGKLEFYSFDKETFRSKPNFIKIEINNLESISNINKISCMRESFDGDLLLGTSNGHILKLKMNERKKNNRSSYVLQIMNEIKLENKFRIDDLVEINSNILVLKDEHDIKILQDNKIIKIFETGWFFIANDYLIIINTMIIFCDIKNNFEEISKIEKKIMNPTMINEKIIIGEDNEEYMFYLIDINERKVTKEKEYKPNESFILKNICKKWAFALEQNDKTKLIKIDLINDNNNFDIICKNEEFIIIESSSFLTNLFDELFIISKNGKIICYGCF